MVGKRSNDTITMTANEQAVPLIRTTEQLRELASQGQSGDGCDCRLNQFQGWDSITDMRWPAAQMKQVADLREPGVDEPTFEEFHPDRTRYESPNAPIALVYFPVNRSTVWRCTKCGIQVMKYTEFGGYYIDHRARVLNASLVVDAPLPN